jgi:dethiobiotin synthase
MKLGLFVSGTDTGIGKTLVSSLLVSSLRSFGIRTGYFKPVQTGTDLDTPRVADLSGLPLSHFPEPSYYFAEPAAPYRAALHEGTEIQIDHILQSWNKLDDRAWVIEGAGGLLVPLNAKQTMRDLIHALGCRVVFVASTRLGTLNHTLLTLESAQSAGLPIAGLILNGSEDPELESILAKLTDVPVIAKVPTFSATDPHVIQEKAPLCFSASILRLLYE